MQRSRPRQTSLGAVGHRSLWGADALRAEPARANNLLSSSTSRFSACEAGTVDRSVPPCSARAVVEHGTDSPHSLSGGGVKLNGVWLLGGVRVPEEIVYRKAASSCTFSSSTMLILVISALTSSACTA